MIERDEEPARGELRILVEIGRGSAQLIVSQNVTFGNLDGIIIDDGNITSSALVMIENNSLTDDTCVGIWLNTSVLGAARVSITGNTVSGTTQTRVLVL